MIRINEIKLSLDEGEELLKAKASKILKINQKYIKSLTIFKKSVDARRKSDVHFTYSVDVEIALDEEQIVRKCKSNKVSIANIYKYEMPVCNGLQTLEMIRSEADYADIPVVFLTGVSDTEKVKEAIKLKPQGYILKNTDRIEFMNKINAIFGK